MSLEIFPAAGHELKGRKPFIGGNWKSNGSRASVEKLVQELNQAPCSNSVDVCVAPTFIHLDYVHSKLKPEYLVAAQNCSKTGDGAFTGEISAAQLKDFGLSWVILGHSERRQLYLESDEVVAEKVAIAQKNGLHVIACVGETLDERKADQTLTVVTRQLQAIAAKTSHWSGIVIAYEPVWAIGTGVVASPQQAQEVHAAIRKWLHDNVSEQVAATTRIIYGGSVKADNSDELFAQTDIDGFLVGGASLKGKDFARIVLSATTVNKAKL